MLNAIAFSLFLMSGMQDTPTDIPKDQWPATAECLICTGHGREKPAGGVRYKGKAYYFCNTTELAEFKKNPEAYLPPVLPRPAPKLQATTLDGKTVTLEDYKGKVVLVDFWATWCKPCVAAMPHLEKLHQANASKGFTVVGISIDEDPKKVGPFQAKRKFSYPILLDDKSSPSWKAFNVAEIPALFLIDCQGNIVAQWRGTPKARELEQAVDRAVAAQ